jgi:hypothetical protein
MAIPKKGSRTLSVNGVRYRWRIRRKPTYDESIFSAPFSVAVERVEPPSHCVLVLAAGFPRPDSLVPGSESLSVTPRMIAASIEDALSHGWQPERAGSAFTHPLQTAGNVQLANQTQALTHTPLEAGQAGY